MIMITQKTRLSLYLVWSQTRQAILPSVSGCGSSFLHDPVLSTRVSLKNLHPLKSLTK